MIHVIAVIEVVAGQRNAFLDEFRKLVPEVRAERGCIEYGPAIDVATPIDRQAPLRANTVTVIEKWQDLPALQAHLAAPHMNAFRQRVGHLLAGMTLHILEPA